MSSNDSLTAWVEKYKDLVQRLDAGSNERQKKLAVARRNLDRARRALDSADPDGAVIAAEAAMVNAADAVIATLGLRLRGKTSSHDARFAFPLLPSAFTEHRTVLFAARRARNTALYDEADTVPESLAVNAVRAAEQLIAAVEPGYR